MTLVAIDGGDWASRTMKWLVEMESGVEDQSLRLSREEKLLAKRGEEREREIGNEREEEGKKKLKTDGHVLFTRSIGFGINIFGCTQDSSLLLMLNKKVEKGRDGHVSTCI